MLLIVSVLAVWAALEAIAALLRWLCGRSPHKTSCHCQQTALQRCAW